MKRRLLILLILCLIGLTGCSYPGPDVTEVGYDSEGNMVITTYKTQHRISPITILTLGIINKDENPQITVIEKNKPIR